MAAGPAAPYFEGTKPIDIRGAKQMTVNGLVKGILYGGVAALLFIVVAGVLQPGRGADSEINKGSGSIAIHGFDPVAYFTKGKAVEGSPDFTFAWKDAVWRFANAEHRNLFADNPGKYAPQYGGY
ncbi:MAG: YHS domain-containing (seleno)protein [Rhodospirillales bacterium]|nr:YHS domain-containing (seleno)protein [Rhodospirillales bacterium]MDP6646641.1 YHS domain-containing (seleno)protein [Rhodospirillales bacterium]MDP6840948.1 YHS domain-containing (seleno)protein [Rhodospirillales bacterium]